MLKLSRLPLGLLALTVAAPVFAQPATTTTNPTPPAATTAPSAPAMRRRIFQREIFNSGIFHGTSPFSPTAFVVIMAVM